MYVCTVWLIRGVGQAHPIVGPVVYGDDTWFDSAGFCSLPVIIYATVELLDEVTIPYKTLMSIAMH